MDSETGILLVIFVGLIFLSGFFSGSESALFSLGLYRVRRIRDSAPKSFQAAQELLKEPARLISTLLTGNEIVNGAISVTGSVIVYRILENRIDTEFLPVAAVALVLPFVLIFGEIIPKTFGVKKPERFVSLAALPLKAFSKSIAPIRDLLTWVPQKLLSVTGVTRLSPHRVSEDVFRSMVDVGTQEGILDTQERQLIHNVYSLDDVRVSQIMTPVNRVSCLLLTMKVKDLIQFAEEESYSRFPVIQEDSRQVVGVLYMKDLLGYGDEDLDNPIQSYMRPALGVRPEANALELFAQFRARRTHFAVVLSGDDGKMLGVVTLEDVLEEIFGDILDERDVEEANSK